MFMVFFIRKRLTALLLLVIVLILPSGSMADGVIQGATKQACELSLAECADADGSSDRSGSGTPHNNATDCCDGGECAPDAAETFALCDHGIKISSPQIFSTVVSGYVPDVFLSIFVPPES